MQPASRCDDVVRPGGWQPAGSGGPTYVDGVADNRELGRGLHGAHSPAQAAADGQGSGVEGLVGGGVHQVGEDQAEVKA